MQYWPAPSCPAVARSERPAGSSPRAALSGVGWLLSGRQYPAHMTPAPLPPFHLAIPVHDIDAARHFYGEVLGFGRGRSSRVPQLTRDLVTGLGVCAGGGRGSSAERQNAW